jgi:hypothetical protein
VSFSCPRTIEGHEIFDCAYKFIKWENVGAGTSGVYSAGCSKPAEGDEEVIISWIIGPEMTTKAGKINFQLGFLDTAVDATHFKWMTEPCKGELEIGSSLFNSEIDSVDNLPIIPDTEISKNLLEEMLKGVYGI